MKMTPTRNAEPIRENDVDLHEMLQVFCTANILHLYDHFKFKAQSRYAKAKSFAEARQYLSLILYIEHRANREHAIIV